MDIKVELPKPRIHPLLVPRARRTEAPREDPSPSRDVLTAAHAIDDVVSSIVETALPPRRRIATTSTRVRNRPTAIGSSLVAPTRAMHEAPPLTFAERVAELAGFAVAPLFALASLVRRARTFHPEGDVFRGEAIVAPRAYGAEAEVGKRLAGKLVVRLSSALRKGEPRYPDVLGCAIRFGGERARDRQDVLFATVRTPYFLFLSPFFTRVDDYLENDYFGVSPFQIEGLGRRYLRLRPVERTFPVDPTTARDERIELDARDGQAVFTLGTSESAFGPFSDVALVALVAKVDPDSHATAFSPTSHGRGLAPVGVVHALQRGVYAASQWARSLVERKASRAATA